MLYTTIVIKIHEVIDKRFIYCLLIVFCHVVLFGEGGEVGLGP